MRRMRRSTWLPSPSHGSHRAARRRCAPPPLREVIPPPNRSCMRLFCAFVHFVVLIPSGNSMRGSAAERPLHTLAHGPSATPLPPWPAPRPACATLPQSRTRHATPPPRLPVPPTPRAYTVHPPVPVNRLPRRRSSRRATVSWCACGAPGASSAAGTHSATGTRTRTHAWATTTAGRSRTPTSGWSGGS
eukprot:scaffold8889_cov100-Isochrysis_galbana.AAC.7